MQTYIRRYRCIILHDSVDVSLSRVAVYGVLWGGVSRIGSLSSLMSYPCLLFQYFWHFSVRAVVHRTQFSIALQRIVPVLFLYNPHPERDAHQYLVLALETPGYLLMGACVPLYLLLQDFLPRYA